MNRTLLHYIALWIFIILMMVHFNFKNYDWAAFCALFAIRSIIFEAKYEEI